MSVKDKSIKNSFGSFLNHRGDETRYQMLRIPTRNFTASALMGNALHEKKEIIEQLVFLIKDRLLPKEPSIAQFVIFYCPPRYQKEIHNIFTTLIDHKMLVFDTQLALKHIIEAHESKLYFGEPFGKNSGKHLGDENSASLDTRTFEQKQLLALQQLQNIIDNLIEQGLLKIVLGDFPDAQKRLFVPLSPSMLLLSDRAHKDNIVVNTHFFLMEILDLLSPFDRIGDPYGLLQIGETMLLPPLYHRYGFFLSKDKKAYCKLTSIFDISIKLSYEEEHTKKTETLLLAHGKNQVSYYRKPEQSHCNTRSHKRLLVFSGGELVAIIGNETSSSETIEVPNAGFIVGCNEDIPMNQQPRVEFIGDEHISFSIQTGPMMRQNGNSVEGFTDDYYKRKGVPYPPTHYPLDWHKGAAPRIMLGAFDDADGTFDLAIIWIEGCRMFERMQKSEGASLEDSKILSEQLGLRECIHLDGGGSAQIIYQQERVLNPSDFRDGVAFERPVGLGMGIHLI